LDLLSQVVCDVVGFKASRRAKYELAIAAGRNLQHSGVFEPKSRRNFADPSLDDIKRIAERMRRSDFHLVACARMHDPWRE
jgi:hypothetical protein